MFRRTAAVLRYTAMSLFVKTAFAQPNIAKLSSWKKKNAVVQKAWKALKPAQKAALAKKAAKIKVAPKKKAPLGKYQKFVKANYKSVKKMPFKKRMAVIAKKWKATQKK